jgi:hypothetical protein
MRRWEDNKKIDIRETLKNNRSIQEEIKSWLKSASANYQILCCKDHAFWNEIV